ncbi:hypothetical protein CcrC1_gp235c [Caulobacter phage C1]|nr:hypothetical protein CcrC1_gp235c [Caulobacter phage C1]UTU08464.1 hypothetical protein CcrC2_gp236c [Caulobacter phage C2]UTU08981.1 hypothetical protein CcrJ4_gp230c [Caulobacter phage J4]UTU10097.1 hypothetical protein CcrRB23_gp235c [Caulobacter phage RB23]WGN97132.1 hypothetical protein [Bertelyvirus sp.]
MTALVLSLDAARYARRQAATYREMLADTADLIEMIVNRELPVATKASVSHALRVLDEDLLDLRLQGEAIREVLNEKGEGRA